MICKRKPFYCKSCKKFSRSARITCKNCITRTKYYLYILCKKYMQTHNILTKMCKCPMIPAQELHETQPLLEHSILVPEEHAHLQHVREPLQKNKSNTLQKLDDTQSKLISPDLLQAKREILSRSRWQLEKLYHDFNASSDRIHTYCLLTRNDKVRIPMSLWYWYRCSFTREGQWEAVCRGG